jgi:hypothetical protein
MSATRYQSTTLNEQRNGQQNESHTREYPQSLSNSTPPPNTPKHSTPTQSLHNITQSTPTQTRHLTQSTPSPHITQQQCYIHLPPAISASSPSLPRCPRPYHGMSGEINEMVWFYLLFIIFYYIIIFYIFDCENVKLWKCEIVKMWNCEIVKLWNCEIVKLWNCEIVKLWNCEIVKLWNCEIVKLW